MPFVVSPRKMELVREPDPQDRGFTMNEGEPSVPPSGDATKRPAIGGTLLDALDAALVAAWDDDTLVEVLAHHEPLVGAVADLELSIEVLRSALERLSPPTRPASGQDRGRKRK